MFVRDRDFNDSPPGVTVRSEETYMTPGQEASTSALKKDAAVKLDYGEARIT
jgi:hypothetical protein